MSSSFPVASPEIVAAWVAGWARSRRVGPPVGVMGGHHVTVGLPQQRARYVFAAIAHGDLRRLAGEIPDPWIFLKVCEPTAALDAVWPHGWVVQPEGFMMTAALAPSVPPDLPPGYRLVLTEDPSIVATVLDGQGAVAASGRASFAAGHATIDQIVTDENHRRRGLGRVVMAALSEAALARDIRRGILVATPMGRQLYEALGWRLHAHFTTAVIPGEPA